MKEQIQKTRLLVESEEPLCPGGTMWGVLMRGAGRDFAFSEAANTWIGRRKSRRVFHTKNVTLRLRVDGRFRMVLELNPEQDRALLEDATLMFEQLDAAYKRMQEIASFLAQGLAPSGKRKAKGGSK